MTVFNVDCREGMKWFPDNTFDSIVCDPPYELGFMGKSWDSTGIANDPLMWAEALRVLKPGGHLLAFSGSRTYHRVVCAIEDAGFEIRDQIMWIYGSGFPKSRDVSKAIDSEAGAAREVIGAYDRRSQHDGANRTSQAGSTSTQCGNRAAIASITAPATEAAQQWQGWGTALKPAHEPICVARKPLIGTVAANVLQFGTGAINIDGCRVGTDGGTRLMTVTKKGDGIYEGGVNTGAFGETVPGLGRWPANVIHDGSGEVLAGFPQSVSRAGMRGDMQRHDVSSPETVNVKPGTNSERGHNDAGSAARFFYCAKASKRDRDEGLDNFTPTRATFAAGTRLHNNGDGTPRNQTNASKNTHPTVKPTDLMRYLCRLVTPPGGSILDPFAGSGSTGKAAALEGFTFIGFELDAEHTEIANARIKAAA